MKMFQWTMLGATLILLGCAGMPKNAGPNFTAAREAIELTDKTDADEVFPKTVELAERTFDSAVDKFEESEDVAEENPALAQQLRAEADKEADHAQKIAQAVNGSYERVVSWDNGEGKASLLSRDGSSLGNAKEAMLVLRQPVAFYGNNQVQPGDEARENTNRLAQILKDHEDLRVQLVGYTDTKGNANYNKDLSQRRAQEIAILLQEAGVDKARIEILAVGESMRPQWAHSTDVKMNRRVDAVLQNRTEKVAE